MDLRINNISNVYNVNSVQVKSKIGVEEVNDNKALEVSDSFKDYQQIQKTVSNASDVREDKVNEIKDKISKGTYKIDMSALADKMLIRI